MVEFGVKGLPWPLDGVEYYSQRSKGEPFFRELKEKGRGYMLELQSNKTGHNLLVAFSLKARRFSIIFSKGVDLVGWATLAKKLDNLGLISISCRLVSIGSIVPIFKVAATSIQVS